MMYKKGLTVKGMGVKSSKNISVQGFVQLCHGCEGLGSEGVGDEKQQE